MGHEGRQVFVDVFFECASDVRDDAACNADAFFVLAIKCPKEVLTEVVHINFVA